ncbi:hypothetical protein ACTFIT_009767 [Dictyostelium discoideum]
MDLKKVDCIICKQPIKCFKDIVIHFIKHNDRCPICLSKYTSFSKMYALTGHYYSQGCNNKKNNIKGEQKLQDEFYQRLSKITGDNIIYPTNLSDDPFNHMSQQNLNENFIIDENNNNLENENENENENNSFEDIGNILNQNGQENDDIEILKEKENGNLGKELNNYEIGFLKLGLENAKSLKFMQQILDFFKNNINAINEIRYTTKYMDSIFLANLPIDGHFLSYKYYEESIFYYEICSVVKLLIEKKNFLEYLDFSKDYEQGIYKNYKSGEQFKKIKNSISDKFILLRIFSDGMSHQGRSDYTIMVDFENYNGPFFKNNKIVLFIVPKEWFHNIHQTIKKLFSAQFNNKLIIKDNNGNDYEIIPYGLTMDIPEFRSSCRINHYNCNEFSCHTCDKARGVDYLLKEGNYRNQKDIIDFHNSKPNKQDFLNPQNKILKLETEQKMKKIGITDYDRSWVENLKINYLYLQPDILHNILLGIVQWVLNYIFKKYKDQITIFIKKLKEAKIIPDHLPPSESLFGVKTRKGRENRSILYYILFFTKSNVSNDDFLLLEEMVQITFLLYQDSFDEDDLDKINYLVKNFNKKIFMIIPNEPINFHLLLHYPLYIKNWGAPKFTSAERFEAQFSKIKDLLTNNTNNQDQHKFERVTKILMATFLDNFNNLKEKDYDNNDLILGQIIKKNENIYLKNNILSDINLHYKNIENIQFKKKLFKYSI